jgi:hypothetical protein
MSFLNENMDMENAEHDKGINEDTNRLKQQRLPANTSVPAMYKGFLTNLYSPVTTSSLVGVKGIGVPLA